MENQADGLSTLGPSSWEHWGGGGRQNSGWCLRQQGLAQLHRPASRSHHSFSSLGSLTKWVIQQLDPSPGKQRHINSTPLTAQVAGEREQAEPPNQPLLSNPNMTETGHAKDIITNNGGKRDLSVRGEGTTGWPFRKIELKVGLHLTLSTQIHPLPKDERFRCKEWSRKIIKEENTSKILY